MAMASAPAACVYLECLCTCSTTMTIQMLQFEGLVPDFLLVPGRWHMTGIDITEMAIAEAKANEARDPHLQPWLCIRRAPAHTNTMTCQSYITSCVPCM